MTTVLLAGGGTGGHLMPALAIAEAIRADHPDWRYVFAGAERGLESSVLPQRGVPHHLLPLEPIYRQQWWKNFRWPLLLPRLLRRINQVLDVERPDLVIGTGGYVSGPVVWLAARRGIPTAILELDVRPGAATRLLAGRARAIWVAAPETVERLARSARTRTTITGAPIIAPDFSLRERARAEFGLTGDRPVVVITGGSQGSLAMNRVVAEWIESGGAAELTVIWATGRGSHEQFAGLARESDVQVIPFIDPMSHAWAVADLCVARAGMMTLSELAAWGVPAILIPLPTAAADHQTFNARAAEGAGAAVLLRQADATGVSLGAAIATLVGDPVKRAAMREAALARGRPDAAGTIARAAAALAAG